MRSSCIHPSFIGKIIISLPAHRFAAIVTLNPGTITAATNAKSGKVETMAPALDPAQGRVLVKEMVKASTAKLDLGDGTIIVSGGRGLRSAENFKLVEDLAAASATLRWARRAP